MDGDIVVVIATATATATTSAVLKDKATFICRKLLQLAFIIEAFCGDANACATYAHFNATIRDAN